jgi:DNA processing protein
MNEICKEKVVGILPSSEYYPVEWKNIPDAPSILYAYGNLALLKKRKFVVVGSRRTPANSLKLASTVAKELSSVFVIVTGSADGGDSAAIEGALSGSGEVICLLAGGFSAIPQGNYTLMMQVAKKGLLLSPHPFETEIRSYSYEYRNKLLGALGEGTLLISAGEKSGALITAKYAKKFGKALFAFPYPPASPVGCGCNALIKQGAFLTEEALDIAEKFSLTLQKKASVALSREEELILSAFEDCQDGHVSELSAKSGIPVFKARSVLSALEVKGVAVNVGGNRYAPV